MRDGTLGEMVYGRWYIKRDGLWKDGTLRNMVYGKWYIRKDGLWEMSH